MTATPDAPRFGLQSSRTPRLRISAPLPVDVYARRPSAELPYPLSLEGASVFAQPRHAVWQGAQAVDCRVGDEVLMPAYHHGAEVEAIIRAGLRPRFFDVGPALEPDGEELESLLGPRVRALYLIHYFGMPQDAARWRSWCDDHDLLLIEDATCAWLASDGSGPVGSQGDMGVFGLAGTVAVPDGAVLAIRSRAPGPDAASPAGVLTVAKLHAAWLAQRSAGLLVIKGDNPPAANGTLPDFDIGDPGSAASSTTAFLLPRLATPDVAAERRLHHRLLLEHLDAGVMPPFDKPAAGASPFAVPVETDDKRRLIARLGDRGVEAVDLWPVPHPSLPARRFPGAESRRTRTVAVPVHQELRPDDMERIAVAVRGRPRPGRELRLERVSSLGPLRDEWTDLAERSDNVFATWEWTSRWWQRYGSSRSLLLTAARSRDGRLVAVLPMYTFATRPMRILRFIGHGTADQLGPVCAPEDRLRVARAMRELLGVRRVPWDLFLGELLPGGEGWSGLLGARTISREASPVLRVQHPSWDAYLAARGRNFRKREGKTERRLFRAHDVKLRLADDPERLSQDLDQLFALHRMQWSDDESLFGANEDFHRGFAAQAFDRGWLRLWLLEVDGRAVAAEYTLRFAGVQSHYQGGRHLDWDDFSVGAIVFNHAIREAVNDGVRECRFLRGGEAYKYRFATHDPQLETVGLARGSFRHAALAASAMSRGRLRDDRLRRWLAT